MNSLLIQVADLSTAKSRLSFVIPSARLHILGRILHVGRLGFCPKGNARVNHWILSRMKWMLSPVHTYLHGCIIVTVTHPPTSNRLVLFGHEIRPKSAIYLVKQVIILVELGSYKFHFRKTRRD